MSGGYKKATERILASAGIRLDGNKPWDIVVNNDSFYKRVFTEGELGLGETYMEGWWEAERVDECICKLLQANLDDSVKYTWPLNIKWLESRFLNLQTKRRAFIVGREHYDLGNELFKNMLDARMNYSCAYWKYATNLDQAQEDKLDLICRKLFLKPGMTVLDIGCGWGAFGKFAAEKYNVKVVGITVSKEQAELGKRMCKGLPVEFRLMDYRDINETFDRIVSVGMLEHVGYRNYRKFFETANRCLRDGGLFLLHTIGSLRSVMSLDPWTNKYIFPNAMLPSLTQLGSAAEGLFIIEDLHNFGKYYDETLISWYNNFKTNWIKLENSYNSQFFRMWEYYLLSCAASFRARKNQLWQIVLSKIGTREGYESVR
jgi:cyclopropane-fatty-acyl-phospholipid synthase